jgi:protein phosphatase
VDIKNAIDVDSFNGILTISDIHGEYYTAKKAVDIAIEQNYLVVFLGDLLDGGPWPTETLLLVKQLLDSKLGILIIGNHDDKMYRYAIGNDVKLGSAQIQTLRDAPDIELYQDTLRDVYTHPLSSYYAYYKQYMFVHAAVDASLWGYPDEVNKKQKAMCIYGEVDGTRDERGFPKRTYEWCESIPSGHFAFVGHDRSAKGKLLTEIGEYTNPNNGTAYFTDCSCGKEPVNGPVGVAIIVNDIIELLQVK